jgi:quercetin dioxygenase-like cupin family protein
MRSVKIARFDAASSYEAPRHHGCTSFRVQGLEATPVKNFWVAISHFLPAGGAELDASPLEKVYVVLSGEITVEAGGERHTLRANDSCFIAANEARSVLNESHLPASMIVVIATHPNP